MVIKQQASLGQEASNNFPPESLLPKAGQAGRLFDGIRVLSLFWRTFGEGIMPAARTISACGAFCERSARSFAALILVGSLIGCSSSSGLPTQRAYSVANLEQPQQVSFYCGKLVAVAPAILPNPIPPGIGITPGISRWLVGLHAGAVGPNAGVQVSGGFLDLYGIASAPEAPLTEYTVLLRTGTNPPNPTLPGEPMSAVVVVQNASSLYNDSNLVPGAEVVVRVVGNSGRVMTSPFGAECAGGFPWYPQSASVGGRQFPPSGSSGLPDWQLYAANHLAAKTPMPVPLQGPIYDYPAGYSDTTIGAGAIGHNWYPAGGMGSF